MAPNDTSSFEETNLVWTSWRKHKITNRLQTYEDYILQHGQNCIDRIPSQSKIHVRKLYGRMEDNFHLSNKKGLLLNLKEYYRLKGKCVFESKVLPYTFLLKSSDKT